VNKDVFNTVLDAIKGHSAFSTSQKATDIGKQLAIFLYRVGSVRPTVAKIASLFEVSPSTVVGITERVADAIIGCLGDEISMPTGGAKLRVGEAFAARGYPGAIAIIDCTSLRMVVPTAVNRAGNRDAYCNRKGVICQTYQVACGPNMKIFSIYGGHCGTTHDSVLFTESPLYTQMRRLLAPDEYYMGDLGYTLRPYLQTGFNSKEVGSSPELAWYKTLYNRHFSGMRITIERCFGVLKARFPALLHGMWYRDRRMYSKTFHACCVLHNMSLRDPMAPKDIMKAIKAERRLRKADRDAGIRAARAPIALAVAGLEAGRKVRAALFKAVTTMDADDV